MSISMQNHGGYTEKYDNFDEKVRLLGLNYPDVNQYLSLVHESDSALEYLISYFQNVEDPVEIVFFGDHQPSLSSSFYPNLNGKGLSGLTEDELQARVESHFVDYAKLKANDFNGYFIDRAKNLLSLIEKAMNKPVTDRDAENTLDQFGASLA